MSDYVAELSKIPAFFRRDLLVAWSYRLSFVSEWLTLVLQAITFYYVSKLIRPSALPSFHGTHATYMQFVLVGMVVTAMTALAVGRVASAIRGEQLMGTLESVLLTPTALATLQVGSVVYDFVYIPVRLIAFFV